MGMPSLQRMFFARIQVSALTIFNTADEAGGWLGMTIYMHTCGAQGSRCGRFRLAGVIQDHASAV